MSPADLAAIDRPSAASADEVARTMRSLGERARQAADALATSSGEARNAALGGAAQAIRGRAGQILAANRKDCDAGRTKGLSMALLDRLALDAARVEAMARGLEQIAALRDPLGEAIAAWERPNGLHIERVRTPLGVIGVIYESRPNVTADAAGLCLKAGNAAILRCGSESFRTSGAIMAALADGIHAAGLPEASVQLVPTTDRAAVGEMLRMDAYIDVIVPRGGKSLIERISAESRVPLFKHLEGLCHTYVHAGADADIARRVVFNAKMRRPGICGATETLLVDRAVAAAILPPILEDLIAAGCEIRGDEEVQALDRRVRPAAPEDWDTEYLDAILSVGVVDGLDEAIAHIKAHGSQHTEAIITEDKAAAEAFFRRLDSAILLLNASTQFADGGEFGMGAEIGIATGKLHARGPVGVEQLTSFKYVVRGAGQCRP
ncbi:MAG: glutamate-5-semialdehyde dehydrogenase [Rhodospirillales bacterium]|jgi:glutamate-5-semialdehyde dehydrogenase|nr:glutamate-5-semialdehyde dehydrogenase [Rhodospirillales bacterium]